MVFLHGFLGSSADWDPVIARLQKDYFCLAIDLPGHGATALRPAHFSSCADLIRSVFPPRPVHLVGYSMGGRLAFYLALHYPQLFSRVSLESTSPGLRTLQEQEQRRAQDERRACELETGDFALFLRHWYSQSLFSTLDVEAMIAKRSINDPAALAASLRILGLGSQPSLWGKLKETLAPLQLIVGEKDEKYRQIAEEICGEAPHIPIRLMRGCSHHTHEEDCETFCRFLIGAPDV